MTKTTTAEPIMTREAAIAALVERDVAKWGEGERDAATRMRSELSHGLALNALATYDGEIDRGLLKQAKALLSKVDRKTLRTGG